jgi:hypothetical protein
VFHLFPLEAPTSAVPEVYPVGIKM